METTLPLFKISYLFKINFTNMFSVIHGLLLWNQQVENVYAVTMFYFTFFRCSTFIKLAQACRKFVIIQYFCLTCYNTCHVVKKVCQMLRNAALAIFKDVILVSSLLKTLQLYLNCIRQDSICLSLTQYDGPNFFKENIYTISFKYSWHRTERVTSSLEIIVGWLLVTKNKSHLTF